MPGGTAAASAASCLAGAVMLEMSCSGEGDPCLDILPGEAIVGVA